MNDAWRGIDPPSHYVHERFIATGAGRFMKALPILRPLPLKAGHAGPAVIQAA